jgi:HEAT repeat protein
MVATADVTGLIARPLAPIRLVTMTSMTGLMALVGSSLLLWLALAALAVTRKLRRDGRERRSAERRTRYQTVLRGDDHAAIVAINEEARGAEAQVDLAVSIDAVHDTLSHAQLVAIGRAAQESHLRPALIAELSSRRPVTRARAALLLTRTGAPQVIDHVVPLLRDVDPDVRLVACSGLARIATPRAAEALVWGLVARVLPPERIIERLAAPWAVATILRTLTSGPTPVPEALRGATAGGREAELDASLARALGIAGDPRGERALVVLLEEGSEEVRVSAARALGRVGATAGTPALVHALGADAWPVRAQAAKSLGALSAGAALAPLERCLCDRAWWVRANAARALRELGEPGLDALRRALEHEDRYAADRAREQLALHAVLQEHAAA